MAVAASLFGSCSSALPICETRNGSDDGQMPPGPSPSVAKSFIVSPVAATSISRSIGPAASPRNVTFTFSPALPPAG